MGIKPLEFVDIADVVPIPPSSGSSAEDSAALAERYIGTQYDVIKGVSAALPKIEYSLTLIDSVAANAQAAEDNRIITDTNAASTTADRAQTALDVIATAADRVQTGLDRDKTTADVAQTTLDAATTTSDRLIIADHFDNFDSKYLGSKAAAPTADNDGAPLVEGALYWNTLSKSLLVYSGTVWEDPVTEASASATAANASALAAGTSETNADADATQTALDRIATAADRVKTTADALQTAGDRAQTTVDALATAADRLQTDLDSTQTIEDAAATAADRVQTGLDRDKTTADVVITTADVIATTAAKDKAEAWATHTEDIPVEPGEYSAKHHALKSAAHATQTGLDATATSSHRADAQDAATSAINQSTNIGSMLGINFGSWLITGGELVVTHLSTTAPSIVDGELLLTYEAL